MTEQKHHAESWQAWTEDHAHWSCSCGAGGEVPSMTEVVVAIREHQQQTTKESTDA